MPVVAADSWTSIFAASRTTRPPLAMAAVAAAVVVEGVWETEEGVIRSGAAAGYKPGGE